MKMLTKDYFHILLDLLWAITTTTEAIGHTLHLKDMNIHRHKGTRLLAILPRWIPSIRISSSSRCIPSTCVSSSWWISSCSLSSRLLSESISFTSSWAWTSYRGNASWWWCSSSCIWGSPSHASSLWAFWPSWQV